MALNAKADGNVSVGVSQSQLDISLKTHTQDQPTASTAGMKWQASSITELLSSINHVINSDDADLKRLIADRNLPVGKLKTQRQYTIIESLLTDSIPSLITGAMQKVSESLTSAIQQMSNSITGTIQDEIRMTSKPNKNSDDDDADEQRPSTRDKPVRRAIENWAETVRRKQQRMPIAHMNGHADVTRPFPLW